jgi:hypothetical protein
LDNTFTFNFTVSCRSQRCPDLTTSQANTQVIAQIHTENFCPSVYFEFPLAGQLSTWLDGFLVPQDAFFVYNYPITERAAKTCVKATVFIDVANTNKTGVITPQGTTGQQITRVFYRNLVIQRADDPTRIVTLLRTSSNGITDVYEICPGLDGICAPGGGLVDLVIDTFDNNNNFPELEVNEAGACFFLTRNRGPILDPGFPRGLLDDLALDYMAPFPQTVEGGIALNILAQLGVRYDDEEPALRTRNVAAGNSAQQTVAARSTVQIPTESMTSAPTMAGSASSVVASFALIVVSLFALFF